MIGRDGRPHFLQASGMSRSPREAGGKETLGKASRAISAAETLLGAADVDFAAGRAYYAMFYVAEALLVEKGKRFRKHSAVHATFRERHMMSTRRNLLLCVRNDGYEASLERWKIYQALPDRDAAKHQQVRVVDESGEHYPYPATFFAHNQTATSLTQSRAGRSLAGRAVPLTTAGSPSRF